MTEKFKKMPFKKKAEHIWEYYKVPIFLTAFVILITGWLINDVFINPAPKPFAWVSFYDNYINSEITGELSSSMTKKLVPEEENLEVRFSSYYESKDDPTVAVDMHNKFEMLYYAGEIDIIITGKNEETKRDYFTEFAKQGALAPLDIVLTKEELSSYEEKGLLLYCEDADGKKRPFGISAKNTSTALKDYDGFNQSSRYIGISNVTKRLENAKEIVKALSE